MSRWSGGYLLDYEPRGSGSIPEVRNLDINIRIPSKITIEQKSSANNHLQQTIHHYRTTIAARVFDHRKVTDDLPGEGR